MAKKPRGPKSSAQVWNNRKLICSFFRHPAELMGRLGFEIQLAWKRDEAKTRIEYQTRRCKDGRKLRPPFWGELGKGVSHQTRSCNRKPERNSIVCVCSLSFFPHDLLFLLFQLRSLTQLSYYMFFSWRLLKSVVANKLLCECYILTYADSHLHTCTYICRIIHNDTMTKTDAGRLLYQNIYLSLYCKGSKRVTQGLRVRRSWRPNRTEIFWPPLLWPSTLCLFRSPDAQPGVLGSTLLSAGFLFCILSTTSLVPKLHRGSRGLPRPGMAFPTTSRL